MMIVLMVAAPLLTASAQRAGRAQFSPLIGYTGYSLAGERYGGATLMLRYTPDRYSFPSIGFYGGATVRFTGSTADYLAQRQSQNGSARFVPILSGGDSYVWAVDDGRPSQRMVFGFGFIGTDATFYFADGPVRPYIGIGLFVALFPYSNSLAAALAPDIRAGLDVNLNSGLSAFGELRHAVGLNQLVSPHGADFINATTVAFGLSFTPRFD
jgi:hypothetical protein